MSGPFQRRLTDHGYKITAHSPCRNLALGTALALHFGDGLKLSADGRPQLTLRAAIEINAGIARGDVDVMHWTITKTTLRVVGSEWMRLVLEIDLFLAGGLFDEMPRGQASLFHRDLRALIEDANTTLDDLPVADTASTPGPILRLEARLVGDLFAGRSGLITAGRAPMTARHREANRGACNWLSQTVLPELATILHLDKVPTPRDLQTA
jgi:hypothetical protein